MKIRSLCLVLLIISGQLYAQNQKGDISVGVSGLPLYFNEIDEPLRFAGMVLKGSFGVFLSSKISLENNLFYYKNNDIFSTETKIQSESYGAHISLRYHYPISDKFTLYGEAGFGLGSVNYSDDYNFDHFSYSQYNSGIVVYSAGIGTLIKLYKGLSFELLIPYIAVYNTTNEINIYGNDRGKLLYGAVAGPNFGLRYSL